MKVFLDANVLFSAAHSVRGRASLLFALAAEAGARLQSSAYAVEEARRNLQARFADRLPDFLPLLPQVQVVPEPAPVVLRRVRDLASSRRTHRCWLPPCRPGPTFSSPATGAISACCCGGLRLGRLDAGHG